MISGIFNGAFQTHSWNENYIKYTLYIALGVIAASGLALSTCSQVSYISPVQGLLNFGCCLSSLTALAIASILKNRSESLSTRNSETPTVEIDESEAALIDTFPDSLFLEFFRYLDARDLTEASLVSRNWHRIALDHSLWQNLCAQEMILPAEMLELDFKSVYLYSKLLKKNLQNIPRTSRLSIPEVFNAPKLRDFAHFYKVNDLFFFYDEKGSFQVWDSSFCRYKIGNEPYKQTARINIQIKRFGQTVYFIGDNGNKHMHPPITEAWIYPFDLNAHQFLPMIKFPPSECKDCEAQPNVFAFCGNKAIFGCREGLIITWEVSRIEAKDKERKSPFPETPLNEKPFQRTFLKGHTSRIIALRTFRNFLFSCSEDGILKQWDLTTNVCIQTIETGVKFRIALLDVAGRYVFANKNNVIYQWDYVTGEFIHHIEFASWCQTFQVLGNLIFFFNSTIGHAKLEIYDLSTKKRITTVACENVKHLSNFVIENHRIYFLGRNELIVKDFSPSP